MEACRKSASGWLGGPQSQPEHCGEEKISCPYKESNYRLQTSNMLSQTKPMAHNIGYSVKLLKCIGRMSKLIHSFIPSACTEFDDFLPFSGASSIPLCYVLFPATLPHQLFFHSLSPHLAIYFLVYLSIMLFPNSCPNQCNLFNLTINKCFIIINIVDKLKDCT